MEEGDKKRTPKKKQTKQAVKSERKDPKPQRPALTVKEIESKALHDDHKQSSTTLVTDSNTGANEVYENLVIHYLDDVNRFEEAPQDSSNPNPTVANVNKDESLDDPSGEESRKDESDSETVKDSVSSQGDSLTAEEEKVDRVSKVPKSVANKSYSDSFPRRSKVRSDRESGKSQVNARNGTPKKVEQKSKEPSRISTKSSLDKNSKDVKVPSKPSSESSEGVDDKPVQDAKEVDVLDEASNSTLSTTSDNETVDDEENGQGEDEVAMNQRIEEMELRIGKLEEELREVATFEISLYSVVPEHGSSTHKVHTPARRLSRLYIHAGKHWTQDKRATIARNTVSGLVLIAKSCGNDVPRLTFWLSNVIVLRDIISQAFGSSCHSSSLAMFSELNGGTKKSEGKSAAPKWKGSPGTRKSNNVQFVEDWQETGTFTAALEKVESWIFSRIVESVWWQALTPHMQSPSGNLSSSKSGRLLGPALGDRLQGGFSINLWKNAFKDAFQRLCPVRAGGHECGCLPIIARMVMEQCVARLDVAMFNAILRESAHEIPTDPVSDPILDSRVLPIPAGDLSFGSGAQLKNSVGNWSRWLTDMFGIDTDEPLEEDQYSGEDDERRDGKPKSFNLLNDLSDLLMLPKDMLMDRSLRKEVCPSIGLPLVKRILCNFTPDEFCPDAVPGAVLEALNAESTVERRMSVDAARIFPYAAAAIVYNPPSFSNVESGGAGPQLSRNASSVQRKGYTSDDELEELDSPLASIIENVPSSTNAVANTNERYELLREVWSA